MDFADWHAAPPLLNLLALWEKGGPLEKEKNTTLLPCVNSWLAR